MSRKILKTFNVLAVIFSVILFFFIGFESVWALSESNSLVISLIYIIATGFISIFLSTLLHELGHIIAGFLSGYSFIMLRIQNFSWINTDDGIKMKKQSVSGVIGQALMVPPKQKEYPPFILYHSGGLLMNFILAIVSLIAESMITNEFISTFFIIFGGINFLLGVLNGIPNGINDGTNLYRSLKSKKQQKQIKQLLVIYKKTILGESLEEIAKEVYIDDDYPVYHSLNSSMQSVYASSFYETFEFERAKEEILVLWEHMDQLFSAHKPDVAQHYLFTLLMTDHDNYLIHKIYNGKYFDPFQDQERADIWRIRSLHLLYIENSPIKAFAQLKKGRQWIEDEPSLTEINLETKLYDYIEKIIKNCDKSGADQIQED